MAYIDAVGFFGEVALLYEEKRSASIRALTPCDLLSLGKEAFAELLDAHPEDGAVIAQFAQTRYEARMKDNLRDELVSQAAEQQTGKRTVRWSAASRSARCGVVLRSSAQSTVQESGAAEVHRGRDGAEPWHAECAPLVDVRSVVRRPLGNPEELQRADDARAAKLRGATRGGPRSHQQRGARSQPQLEARVHSSCASSSAETALLPGSGPRHRKSPAAPNSPLVSSGPGAGSAAGGAAVVRAACCRWAGGIC